MATGTVKWFDMGKGFGFIVPDEGGPDVFVHATAVKRSGYTFLPEGVRVAYEIKFGASGDKMSAVSLRIS